MDSTLRVKQKMFQYLMVFSLFTLWFLSIILMQITTNAVAKYTVYVVYRKQGHRGINCYTFLMNGIQPLNIKHNIYNINVRSLEYSFFHKTS